MSDAEGAALPPLQSETYCWEFTLPAAMPVVIVCAGLPEQNNSARPCTARNAIIAADFLVNHALVMDPKLEHVRIGGDLVSLFDALWPVFRHEMPRLVEGERGDPRRSAYLVGWLEREVSERVVEKTAGMREEMRLAAQHQTRGLIRRLWAAACEPDSTTRAVAVAALAAEVRNVLPNE